MLSDTDADVRDFAADALKNAWIERFFSRINFYLILGLFYH